MLLRRSFLVPLIVLAALLPFAGVSAAHDSDLEVVASGLDNPRGLDFGPWGALYVAEAGRGGEGPCIGSAEEAGIVCAGASGAITKIWHGKQRRVLEGLPSFAAPGSAATQRAPRSKRAPTPSARHDISFGLFSAYLTVGLGRDPAVRDEDLGPLGPKFGQLYKDLALRPGACRWPTSPRTRRPRTRMEHRGAELDSNPNSVLARPARRYVVDAGGNDLLRVGPTGRISTVAVFPRASRAARRIPTSEPDPGRADRGGPRPRSRPVRQPADRLPLHRGSREHLSRRSGTGTRRSTRRASRT